MDPKAELRGSMRRMRAGLSPATLTEAAQAVCERVLALPEVRAAARVFVYVSFRREVPTRPLLEGLLAREVQVAVPRIEGDRMTARALRRWSDLVDGTMGIPTSDGPVVPSPIQVALCPGLAFDLQGGRLGYGGGYYDRWLREHPEALPVALAVDPAVVEQVPVEAHDVRMARVVTPSRVLYCGSQSGANGGETSR
jgi:5-formyltetrahydrofolate cyclo-ligase